jgi:hypothetical protein
VRVLNELQQLMKHERLLTGLKEKRASLCFTIAHAAAILIFRNDLFYIILSLFEMTNRINLLSKHRGSKSAWSRKIS